MDSIDICRVCESSKHLEKIFDKGNKNILDMLVCVVPNLIDSNDMLPKCICYECTENLKKAYNFISKYEITYHKLKSLSVTQKKNVSNQQYSNGAAADTNDNLISEVIVKEELFSDADEESGIGATKENSNANVTKRGVAFNTKSQVSLDENVTASTSVLKNEPVEYDNEEDDDEIVEEEEEEGVNLNVEDLVVKEEWNLDTEDTEQNESSIQSGSTNLQSQLSHDKQGGSSQDSQPGIDTRFPANTMNVDGSYETRKSSTNFENNRQMDNQQKCCPDQKNMNNGDCNRISNCDKHDDTFSTKHNLEVSPGKETDQNSLKCRKCKRAFTSIVELKQHQMCQKRFKCNNCDKSFASNFTLKKHLISHSNPDALKCEYCGKSFTLESNLKRHLNACTETVMHACNKCGKIFTTASALEQHEMLHLNPDIFKCEQCDRRFASKDNLMKHNVLHSNPDSRKCHLCGKCFSTGFRLKEHLMLHSKPELFNCDECGKMFTTLAKIKNHRASHSNPQLVKCKQCGKSFATANTLKEHQLWHSNPDVFQCRQCGKKFERKRSLNRHKSLTNHKV